MDLNPNPEQTAQATSIEGQPPHRLAVLLEEWKRHDASYSAGRGQYFQFLGIFATGYIFGLIFALGPETPPLARGVILAALSGGLATLVVAHRIGLRSVVAYEDRLTEIETILGIGARGYRGLRAAYRTSMLTSAAALVCTLLLLVGFALGLRVN